MVQAIVTRHAATPERWARALDRALSNALEIFTTPDGERFVSSASQLDIIYHCDGASCDCQAAVAGDPVCQHRAVVRWTLGALPVVVVRVDELNPSSCPSCVAGKIEEWGVSGPIGWLPCSVCGGSGVSTTVDAMPAMQPQSERIAA